MEASLVGGRQEAGAGLWAREQVANLRGGEAEGVEELEKELGMEVGGIVAEKVGEGKTEAAIGLGDKVFVAHGGEKVAVEPLGGLEVGDGLAKGGVDGGLDFAQEREETMAHLVATVLEGGVGGVLDMGEALETGIGLDIGSGEGEQRPH